MSLHPHHPHPLTERNPHDLYDLYGGRWNCDNCQYDQSELCQPLHCDVDGCIYDLCRECAKPHMHINHPHPLYLSNSRHTYPEHEGWYTCDECNTAGISNEIYHCYLCKFDVCRYCLNVGDIVPVTPPTRIINITPLPVPVEPLTEVMGENTTPSEEDQCIVCFSRHKTAVIVHGTSVHRCCCVTCALVLMSGNKPCPICREPIDLVARYY